MAYWETQSIIILRGLINDMGPTFAYEDSRLIDLLLISAHLINTVCDFDTIYTINIEETTITPDPGAVPDEVFINLTCLKAACLILTGEAKLLASNSFEVRDGSAMVSAKGAYQATKDLLDKYCDDFDEAKFEFKAGNLQACKAILTPYGGSAPYNSIINNWNCNWRQYNGY